MDILASVNTSCLRYDDNLVSYYASYYVHAVDEQGPKGNFDLSVQPLQVEFHSTLQSHLHSPLRCPVMDLKRTYSSAKLTGCLQHAQLVLLELIVQVYMYTCVCIYAVCMYI